MKSCEICYSMTMNVDPKEELCDTCYYKNHLHNLLALIYGDGGDYVSDYGLEKAVEEAERIIAEKVAK